MKTTGNPQPETSIQPAQAPGHAPDQGLSRRQSCAALASGLALGLGSGAALAQASGPRAADAAAAPAALPDMGPVLQTRLKAEGVGLVCGQWQAGSEPRYTSEGLRYALDSAAVDERTVFEYGSISKTFVALLLADAVQRRELALEDPAETLLPSGLKLRDSAGAPLRLLDLATHRSGLPRLPTNMAPALPADPYADYSAAMLWAFVADWKADVPRASRWEYSNLGYGLLGELLALRLGGSLAQALQERVFQPLNLGSVRLKVNPTATAAPGAVAGPRAQGHDAQRRPVPAWRFQALAGAGALTGDAQDLLRYARAALSPTDAPLRAAFDLSLKRHADGPSAQQGQGLAWLLGSFNGRPLANHDGGTYGFSTSLFLDPTGQRASVVLANAFVPVTDLALHALDGSAPLRDAAKEARERQASGQRQALTLDAQALALFTGVYALNPQFKLSLRVEDGKLLAQATGQGAFELFASGNRSFFARVAPIDIRFEGDSGTPTALLLSQSGQVLRFVRQ